MKKFLSAVLCAALTAVGAAVPSFAQSGVLGIDTIADKSDVNVGDEFYVDFVVKDNDDGFNNITGYVRYNSDVIQAVEVDSADEPSDRIVYNKNGNMAILFPYNVVNSRINLVPKSGDDDYDGNANGVKNAAQIGIVKYSGFLNKSTDGFLDNYEGTGTLLRMKFKALSSGNSNVSFDISLAQSYNQGKPSNLTVDIDSADIKVNGNEASTETTTSAQSSTGSTGGGGGSSAVATTVTATTEASTETTTEQATELTTQAEKTISFTDVEKGSWSEKYIYSLAGKGVVNGYNDGTFKPDAQVKRADFIIMLMRGLNIDTTAEQKENFSDVDRSAYYYNAVGTAKLIGLATGNGDGTFSPNSNITRQDMMILAKRALEYKLGKNITGDAAKLDSFSDKSEVSAYAVESLAAMVDNGLVSGANGKIMPKATTTRAQAAVIIYKLMKML